MNIHDDTYMVQKDGDSTELDSHEVQNIIKSSNSKLMLMSLAAVPVL